MISTQQEILDLFTSPFTKLFIYILNIVQITVDTECHSPYVSHWLFAKLVMIFQYSFQIQWWIVKLTQISNLHLVIGLQKM